MKQFLIQYNDNHILVVDEEGEIGVRKKKMFRRKKRVCHFEAFVSRIEKLLSNESIQNVSVTLYGPRNYYQYFFREKTLMLREDFLGTIF